MMPDETQKKRQNFECESSDKIKVIKEWEKWRNAKPNAKRNSGNCVLDHSTGEGQWNQGHRAKIVKNCHIPQCFPLFKKNKGVFKKSLKYVVCSCSTLA